MGAIIYARQSLDRDGTGAGVERQIADCRALADQRGWTVTDVLTDNDISASTGVVRPGYQKLLQQMSSGAVQHVVVWHLDRLTRRLIDLEEIIALCERTGVRLATVTGDLDLSTDTGRMLARILASVARGEVERKGARQRRANRQRAERGKVAWTIRPFGFDRDGDKVVIVEEEATLIREAAANVLNGGTIMALVNAWNNAGVTTTLGGPWAHTPLRRVLMNPRLAGRVIYRGEDMGVSGPAILDEDTFRQVEETLGNPQRRTNPPTARAKYLLSGIVRCGRCGDVMYTKPDTRKYLCRKLHLSRIMEPVDHVVEGAVVGILSRPDALALLTPDVDVDALRREATALRERRDDLAGLLAEGLLSAAAVREQAGKIATQLQGIEDTIAAATGANPAASVAASADPAQVWADLPLQAKRDIINVLMTITLLPAGKGARFNPDHVQMEPK